MDSLLDERLLNLTENGTLPEDDMRPNSKVKMAFIVMFILLTFVTAVALIVMIELAIIIGSISSH